jgi:hypothetical protein
MCVILTFSLIDENTCRPALEARLAGDATDPQALSPIPVQVPPAPEPHQRRGARHTARLVARSTTEAITQYRE